MALLSPDKLSGKVVILFILIASSLGVVLLDDLVLSKNCTGPYVLSRRDCMLLRSPLIWLAPDRTVVFAEPEILPTPVIPIGVNPTEIKENSPEEQMEVVGIAQTNEVGYVSLQVTWLEQGSGDNALYVVENGAPFIGQLELGSFESKPRSYIINCLIDFIQLPCGPAAPLLQFITLDYGQVVKIPIHITGLEPGLHDLTVVFDQDLGVDRDNPQAEARLLSKVMAIRASIAVGRDTTPIARSFQSLPIPLHTTGLDGLAVSTKIMPWDRYGGIQQKTFLQADPGQKITLYLHLSNSQPVQVDYALSAFLDHKQIPLVRRGQGHVPLYVSAKSQALYVIPIEFTSPSQPGHYEFVVYGEPFPQARMDLTRQTFEGQLDYGLGIDMWSSSKIYLDVNDHKLPRE